MKRVKHSNTCNRSLDNWLQPSQSTRQSCQTWGRKSSRAFRTLRPWGPLGEEKSDRMTNRLRASSWWARGAGPCTTAPHVPKSFAQQHGADGYIALWLYLCCMFLPASAETGEAHQVNSGSKAAWHGPNGSFTGEDEGFLSEVVPVMKLSWPQEFLQQMMASATAADFAEPANQEMDTVDNIAILTNHPDDRHWRFYRPDPHGFGRLRSMDLEVTTQMTLSDVQRRIEEH